MKGIKYVPYISIPFSEYFQKSYNEVIPIFKMKKLRFLQIKYYKYIGAAGSHFESKANFKAVIFPPNLILTFPSRFLGDSLFFQPSFMTYFSKNLSKSRMKDNTIVIKENETQERQIQNFNT